MVGEKLGHYRILAKLGQGRLGRIYEQRDDAKRARELYRTFVEYWNSGDLERQAIADAERFLANGDVG